MLAFVLCYYQQLNYCFCPTNTHISEMYPTKQGRTWGDFYEESRVIMSVKTADTCL